MACRRLITLIFFIHLGLFAAGQNFFIYIQSESRMPFFVKWQDKAFNSSASGYLVIPRVPAGNHVLQVGFSGDSWSLKKFGIRISSKDAGFMLRKKGDEDWVLYNLQTTETLIPEGGRSVSLDPPKSDDAFVNILSDVVNTPSLRIQDDINERKKSEKPVVAEAKKDAAPAVSSDKSTAITPAAKEPVPVTKEIEKISAPKDTQMLASRAVSKQKDISSVPVKKQKSKDVNAGNSPGDLSRQVPVSEKNSIVAADPIIMPVKESRPATVVQPVEVEEIANSLLGKERFIYYKVSEGTQLDTVDVLIEYARKAGREKKRKQAVSAEKENEIVARSEAADPVVEARPAAAAVSPVVVPEKDKSSASFIFCRDSASKDDFLSLRKRMAAEDSEDAMLEKAGKAFKSKCFTTLQVRNLSFLFLDEEKRYLFLEASYPCVPDKVNFSSLENVLTDPVLKKRLQNLSGLKK